MLGRDHAVSGVMVGLACITGAEVLGVPINTTGTLVFTAAVAGAALLPDIDHPHATAARAFGPVSLALARGLDRLGAVVHARTSTEWDRPTRDGHRTITHTAIFALAAGVGAFVLADLAPPWGGLAVLWVLLSLGLRGLVGGWTRDVGWWGTAVTAAALTGVAWTLDRFAQPCLSPALLGVAVAVGSWTHCLGDSCTLHGCPWLWPVRIRGRAWYLIGTPRWMRFRTGTDEVDGEDYLRVLMWVVIGALLVGRVPGAWPWVGERVAALWS